MGGGWNSWGWGIHSHSGFSTQAPSAWAEMAKECAQLRLFTAALTHTAFPRGLASLEPGNLRAVKFLSDDSELTQYQKLLWQF